MKTKTIIKTFLLLSALLMGVGTAWGTSHTVTFYVNGNVLSTAEVEEGAAITFPDVSVPTGYALRGWTKTEIEGTQSTAPSDLTSKGNMGNADMVYYAVFAKVTKNARWMGQFDADIVNGTGTYAIVNTQGKAFTGEI